MENKNKRLKLQETLSKINKFRPKYPSVEYPHLVDVCLKEIIEDVLWDRSGIYEASSSSCGSHKSLLYSNDDTTKSENVLLLKDASDHKLACWRNNLEERRKICEKIMQKTGKKYCNLLLNSINEHRRIELVKRILDYAERLRPDKLGKRRDHISSLEGPCPGITTIYESLPTTEKTGIPIFPIVDVTKKILEEEALEKCTIKKWSWLKSKYLAERLFCKSEDIQRILSFFPDIGDLEVVGQNIKKEYQTSTPLNEIGQIFEFSIENIHFDNNQDKEDTNCLYLVINDNAITTKLKRERDLIFPIVCESLPDKKEYSVLCRIHNGGWKMIEFYWEKEEENISKFIKTNCPPAFFFDKNEFRLMPGQFLQIPLIFCPRKSGIYTETWRLYSQPKFLKLGTNIIFYLLGHCKQSNYNINGYNNLKDNISKRIANMLTRGLLNTVAKQAIPDPALKAPYLGFFTEREIFTNLYPNMNYLQAEMDALKAVYREANIESSCRCCPEWNYDIEALKQQILSIDESEKRKNLYFKMIDIIHRMRRAPQQPKTMYEEQKFLLVKSVIISTLDKLETVFTKLSAVTTKTNLPLEFDEIVIVDRQKKEAPNAPPDSLGGSDDICLNSDDGNVETFSPSMLTLSSVDFADVVKADYVRLKQKQILSDALYLQFFAHLGKAAEEIAAVIEGMKNFF